MSIQNFFIYRSWGIISSYNPWISSKSNVSTTYLWNNTNVNSTLTMTMSNRFLYIFIFIKVYYAYFISNYDVSVGYHFSKVWNVIILFLLKQIQKWTRRQIILIVEKVTRTIPLYLLTSNISGKISLYLFLM